MLSFGHEKRRPARRLLLRLFHKDCRLGSDIPVILYHKKSLHAIGIRRKERAIQRCTIYDAHFCAGPCFFIVQPFVCRILSVYTDGTFFYTNLGACLGWYPIGIKEVDFMSKKLSLMFVGYFRDLDKDDLPKKSGVYLESQYQIRSCLYVNSFTSVSLVISMTALWNITGTKIGRMG